MNDFSQRLINSIPHLRRYARSLIPDKQNSDDLVQDCLDRAWSRMSQWQTGSDMRAWLFTIMHNLHVNSVRSRQRQARVESLHDHEPMDQRTPGQEGIMQMHDLQFALDQLSDEQREILMLVCVEGMGYEEVARVLAIAPGTVMSRLHRARETLRRILKGEQSPSLRRIK